MPPCRASRRPTAWAWAWPRSLSGVAAGCITRAALSAVSPWRTRMTAMPQSATRLTCTLALRPR